MISSLFFSPSTSAVVRVFPFKLVASSLSERLGKQKHTFYQQWCYQKHLIWQLVLPQKDTRPIWKSFWWSGQVSPLHIRHTYFYFIFIYSLLLWLFLSISQSNYLLDAFLWSHHINRHSWFGPCFSKFFLKISAFLVVASNRFFFSRLMSLQKVSVAICSHIFVFFTPEPSLGKDRRTFISLLSGLTTSNFLKPAGPSLLIVPSIHFSFLNKRWNTSWRR